MATAAPVTHDDLRRIERDAWALYGDICHSYEATDNDRRQAFEAAMRAFMATSDRDKATQQ